MSSTDILISTEEFPLDHYKNAELIWGEEAMNLVYLPTPQAALSWSSSIRLSRATK